MKMLLMLVSLSLGTAALVKTVDWMNQAAAVVTQAAELGR